MRLLRIIFLVLIVMFSHEALAREEPDSLDIWDLSLDEILNLKVVAAQKTEREINRIPASVVVITKREIQRYGCNSLQDVLNMVPGLYLWNGYHVRGRINSGIRGYTSSDNVIILVNGVNQVEGVYNEYLLTKVGVPIEAIDRVEVVRGPMSVLYGNGAFFGVINIITNSFDEGSKREFSLLGGSNKYIRGTAKISAVGEEFKVGITASGFYTRGLDQPYKDMMSDPSELLNWGLEEESTTGGMLKEQNKYFNLSLKYKGLTSDFTHTEIERGGFLVQPTVQYSPTRRHSTNFMTSYEHELNKKIKFKGKFSYLTPDAIAFYFLNEEDS
jgi:outer membrane cobalamin receptor